MAKTFHKYLRNAALKLTMALAVATVLSGCDNSFIFDDEGDCSIHYKLRFRFDYNLLFADAFSSQVHSVTVYAFEPDGTFAWMREESGWHLSADGYMMDLDDVPPGDYTLVGWCGMDNYFIDAQRPESFTLPKLVEGMSAREEMICHMNRDRHPDGTAHSTENLWPLFHGTTTDVEILPQDGLEAEGQTIVYSMNLKKNTNRVRVVLQQLSGADINAEDFTFTIETDNGRMAHDNTVLDHENITYHAWNKENGIGGIIVDDAPRARDAVQAKVAIADLTVARLIKDRATTLTVYRPDGEISARIPLVDYALLTKGNYETPMTDQEFLDREDTYTLTFFLDRNYLWSGASLYINSWRVVPGEYGVKSVDADK